MLAIGTNDGIVMLERKNGAWEVAARALPGVRVEGVCPTTEGRDSRDGARGLRERGGPCGVEADAA